MTIQNILFHKLLKVGISSIQSRYIAYKLELKGVDNITFLDYNKDDEILTINSNTGKYKTKILDVDLPINEIINI